MVLDDDPFGCRLLWGQIRFGGIRSERGGYAHGTSTNIGNVSFVFCLLACTRYSMCHRT